MKQVCFLAVVTAIVGIDLTSALSVAQTAQDDSLPTSNGNLAIHAVHHVASGANANVAKLLAAARSAESRTSSTGVEQRRRPKALSWCPMISLACLLRLKCRAQRP